MLNYVAPFVYRNHGKWCGREGGLDLSRFSYHSDLGRDTNTVFCNKKHRADVCAGIAMILAFILLLLQEMN